jgi:XTP/dITP diphosphohydrolase
MADDSGLEVDALGGAPGILSARYAGSGASDGDNLAKLLEAIKDVSKSKRTARFRCVLCLIDPDGNISHYDGTCIGRIATESLGSEGFGYDPAFIPDGYTETFGQLSESLKGQLSHRAKAVESLRVVLA